MTKNPFLNAFVAILYIALVGVTMFYGPKIAGLQNKPDTFMAPIALISLFTFSAAMMGYLFLFQPVQMYLDGKKKEAVNLFTKTFFTFGAITLVLLITLFSGVLF